MTFCVLSGCSVAPPKQTPYTPPMQYLAETPEPDKPTSPVDNGKLAEYTNAFRGQLRECNADKRTLYDLYQKNKDKQ